MSTLRPCLYVKVVWDKKRGTVDTVPPDQALAMSVHNKKTTRCAGGFDFPWWAVQDLNLWPPPCKGSPQSALFNILR